MQQRYFPPKVIYLARGILAPIYSQLSQSTTFGISFVAVPDPSITFRRLSTNTLSYRIIRNLSKRSIPSRNKSPTTIIDHDVQISPVADHRSAIVTYKPVGV